MGDDIKIVFKSNLENGVITIGDLWDARTSRRVGFNLFGNKLSTAATDEALAAILEATSPGEPGTYEFTRVLDTKDKVQGIELGVELTCELLGGLIKISGGAEFGMETSSGTSTEEIKLEIFFPKSDVSIKTNVNGGTLREKELFDKHVDKLLREGKLNGATHVLTGIQIGGKLYSGIKVTQKKTGDKYKFGFGIEGKIELGVLSGRVGASAKIGEDIKISNYEAKLTVKSAPTIPPPTVVEDFLGENLEDASVGKLFTNKMKEEINFDYWDGRIGMPSIVGVPIGFTLGRIDQFWAPPPSSLDPNHPKNPSIPTAEPEYPTDKLKAFEERLLSIHDWTRADCLKRKVLREKPTALKILTSSYHSITSMIVGKEEELAKAANSLRLEGLKAYNRFKTTYFDKAVDTVEKASAIADFATEVDRLVNFCETKTTELETMVGEKVVEIGEEIKAINITKDESQEDGTEPTDEETSPLIFFTDALEVEAWKKTQRFCKLLYRTKLGDEEEEARYTITPQKLYDYSKRLGKLQIQPGITYPTISRRRGEEDSDIVISIDTPNGSLSYGRGEEEEARVNFVMNLITSLSGNFDPTFPSSSSLTHLFITYCELHGLRLRMEETVDLVPMITLLEKMFGGIALMKTFEEMKSEMEERDERIIRLIFSTDGHQSSRHIIHTLLLLADRLETLEIEGWGLRIVCGPFNMDPYPEAPPMFIAWDGELQAVCLDHLDLIVFLDLLLERGPYLDLGEVRRMLILDTETMPSSSLCSKDRLEFAQTALGSMRMKGDMKKSHTVQVHELQDQDKVHLLLQIFTEALQKNDNGTVTFASKLTVYVIQVLDGLMSNDDLGNDWSESEGKYGMSAGDGERWKKVLSLLQQKWDEENTDFGVEFNYYATLITNLVLFEENSGDIPIPEYEPYPEAQNPERDSGETPEEIDWYKDVLLPEIIEKYSDMVTEKFKDDAYLVSNLADLHWRSKVRLYSALLAAEIGSWESQVDSRRIKTTAIRLLLDVIKEIGDGARVGSDLVHQVLDFVLSTNLSSKEALFPPEVLPRIRKNFSQKKYYHVLSEMVENTGGKYEYEGLEKFQLEMQRLSKIGDWVGLLRVVQEISRLPKVATLRRIWSSERFQYLVNANISNKLVLRGLAAAFLNKDGRLPKYIPLDIAKKILALDETQEGDPIGFTPVWDSREILLKSLQVLWVLRVVPENFQVYLLRNMEKRGVAREVLESVGAAFYLEEDEFSEKDPKPQYFSQVWDLATIYDAIIAIVEGPAKRNRNDSRHHPLPNKAGATQSKTATAHFKSLPLKGPLSKALSNTNLEFRRSPPEDFSNVETSLAYFLYFFKTLALDVVRIRNPMELEHRVDLLTVLFSRSEPAQTRKFTEILQNNYGERYGLPLIHRETSSSSFHTSLGPIYFEKWLGKGLPKVVTAVRIGASVPEGKSQLLNILMKEPNCFASAANQSPLPQYLEGYAEIMWVKGVNTNPSFWSSMEPSEEFILINLHGDALAQPSHLQHLQLVTSTFCIFWGPQSPQEIEEGRTKFLEIISPSHAHVSIYIDPAVEEEAGERYILRTPFSEKKSLPIVSKALSSALRRRGKDPQSWSSSSSSIHSATFHKLAIDFAAYVSNISAKSAKSSLILQKGWDRPTLPDLESHYTSHPFYSELVSKVCEILEEPSWPDVLTDLSHLLKEQQLPRSTQFLTAWRRLSAMSVEEFGGSLQDQQLLLGYFQNDLEGNSLSVLSLITELCKIQELSPSKLPTSKVPSEVLADLFLGGHSMLVPSIGRESFFVESWSTQFLSTLPNAPILVVNCVGADGEMVMAGIEGLLGPGLIHDSNSCYSGLSMRYAKFEGSIASQYAVDGVLFLHAKPILEQRGVGHRTFTQRDQQLTTFLLSTSHITIIFDLELGRGRTADILSTSLIALNRIPFVREHTVPSLFFAGIRVEQGPELILQFLNDTERVAKGLVDYGEVSTLGLQVLDKAINEFVKGPPPVFNVLLDESMAPLSDAIIFTLPTLYRNLPDFLKSLGPSWDYIRDFIPFPYPDLGETEKSVEFNRLLNDLLNLADECFTYHVENFPNTIFDEMVQIVNAWANGEEGRLSEESKKQHLWFKVTNNLMEIFESCRLELDEGKCIFCEKYEEVKERVMEEWEDYGSLTSEKMALLIDAYVNDERGHYTGMAKQIMVALEEQLLLQEEGTYKERSKEWTELQEMTLERRVVPSERRMAVDIKATFPGIHFDWDGFVDEGDFGFLQTLPAYLDGGMLSSDEVSWLSDQLRNIPTNIIRIGGSCGIFQMGMARRSASAVEAVFSNSSGNLRDKLVNRFKLLVVSHTLWRLWKKLERSEGGWVKENDPVEILGLLTHDKNI